MGAFIPIKVNEAIQEPDYSAELEQLIAELESNPLLTLSNFCSSKQISYTGFKNYLVTNEISLNDLRTRVSRKNSAISERSMCSDLLANISIKLPNQIEVMIPTILPSQLSDILKSL